VLINDTRWDEHLAILAQSACRVQAGVWDRQWRITLLNRVDVEA
jgi:hypothetical protein